MATALVLKLGNYPKGLKSGTAGFGAYQFTIYTPEHGYELTTVLDESGNELWNKSGHPAVLVLHGSQKASTLSVYTYDGRHEKVYDYLKLDGVWSYTPFKRVYKLLNDYLSSNSINILPRDFDHTKLKRYTLDLLGLDNDPYLVHTLSYNSHGYKLKWLSPQQDTLFNEIKYGHDTLWKAASTDVVPLRLRFIVKDNVKYVLIVHTGKDSKLTENVFVNKDGSWNTVELEEYFSWFLPTAVHPTVNTYLSYHVNLRLD